MSSVYFLSLQFFHPVGVANATRISAVITRHIILKRAMLVSVPSAATIAATLGTNHALNFKFINGDINFTHINTRPNRSRVWCSTNRTCRSAVATRRCIRRCYRSFQRFRFEPDCRSPPCPGRPCRPSSRSCHRSSSS